MAFDTIVENAAGPAEDIISHCRGVSCDDLLQHIINMAGANIFDFKMPNTRIDVFVDTTAQDIWMFPVP